MSAMPSHRITTPVALAVACSLSFALGYLFNRAFGFERSAARQATVEANASQRVLSKYAHLLQTQLVFSELEQVTTLEQLENLRSRYKSAVISSAEDFERQASTLELPEEKRVAEALVAEAVRIKQAVGNKP